MESKDQQCQVLSDHHSSYDAALLLEYLWRSMIALDGLWFLNVMKELGAEKTLEIDKKVIASQFKFSTRLSRQLKKLDVGSVSDKKEIMEGIGRFYGHEFQVISDSKSVTMRLHKCQIYENLKRANRLKGHDCRQVCKFVANEWFKEIEPKTNGAGETDFQIPLEGPYCDWTVYQPDGPTNAS